MIFCFPAAAGYISLSAINLGSVISSIAYLTPSLPEPDCFVVHPVGRDAVYYHAAYMKSVSNAVKARLRFPVKTPAWSP